MRKKIVMVILAVLVLCLCSCAKSRNDSGTDSEGVTAEGATTKENTEETTEIRGADLCPLYMYYEGDLYIPAVNPTTILNFDMTELSDYEYIGNTTQYNNCNDLKENFAVTTLRDNAKVYHNSDEPLDGKPFALLSVNEDDSVWIAYLKLNDRK